MEIRNWKIAIKLLLKKQLKRMQIVDLQCIF